MVSRKSTEAHQRRSNRRAGLGLQFAQQFCRTGAGIDHAAAGIEDRRAGIGDQFDRPGNILVRAALGRAVTVGPLRCAIGVAGHGDLNVLRNVDHDRAGAALRGDLEGLVDRRGKVRRVLHQIVVLGAVTGDADRIGFLERVRTDQAGRNLARDHHQGNRIHEGIGDAGNGIGCAGAGSDEDDAGLAG